MNVIYHETLQRLKYDDKNPEQPRHNHDRALKVRAWKVPGGDYVLTSRPDNAPLWWHGDEDASQSFFMAMGVIADG